MIGEHIEGGEWNKGKEEKVGDGNKGSWKRKEVKYVKKGRRRSRNEEDGNESRRS